MMKPGCVGEFEITADHRARKIIMNLTGKLNKIDVQLKDLEKWQNNLLPSHQFGFIVLTTSAGSWTMKKQEEKNLGGKILGLFF
ncbi:40S ribosomal protein S15a [Lemmus lemmus]